MTNNACEECISYKVNKGIIEPEICENCGKQKMTWKQDEGGFLYLECSNCHETIAVDLNTPCEIDPIFNQKFKLTINPQQKIPKIKEITELSKVFKVNALGTRKLLTEGTSMKVALSNLEVMVSLMDKYNVSYKLENYEDCKVKYPFFRECKYPYSKMRRIFIK